MLRVQREKELEEDLKKKLAVQELRIIEEQKRLKEENERKLKDEKEKIIQSEEQKRLELLKQQD